MVIEFLKSKVNVLFLSLSSIIFFLILFFFIKNAGIDGDDNYKYLHWSHNIFSENYYSILFRPFFYLYGKISLILFNNSDYSIKLSNLFLHVFNFNLVFYLAYKKTNNYFLPVTVSLMYLLNPFLIGALFNEETTVISISLIILNTILFFQIVLNLQMGQTSKNQFLILGLLGCLLFLTHEELVMVFFLNIIFFGWFFYDKLKKNLFFSIFWFVIFFTTFYFLFADEEFVKKTISLILNVIHRDLNFLIRETIMEKEISKNYFYMNYLEFLKNQILLIFSRTYWINSFIAPFLLLFSCIYFFKKKNYLLEKFISIQILSYVIFLLFIRVADRLFLVYLILFYFLISLLFFDLINRKYFKTLTIITLICILSFIPNLGRLKENYTKMFYKSETRHLYDHLKDQINTDNKILMLSSFEDRLPLKSFSENSFSENYSLATFLYFDNNALIFKQIYALRKLDISFVNFLRDEKIRYIIFKENISKKYLVNEKSIENLEFLFSQKKIENLIKLNTNESNEYKKQNSYLKLYNVDFDKMSVISSTQENNLVLDEIEPLIKKITYFSNEKFFDNEPSREDFLTIIQLSFKS